MCGSPRLIAACHVLLRLLMPRHSPCALSSLTSSERISYPSFPRLRENSLTPSLLLSKSEPLRWVPIWAALRAAFIAPPEAFPSWKVSGSLKNYAGLRFGFIVVFVTLNCLKVHKKFTLLPLLLLARNFLLHCSVFKVQSQPLSRSDRNAQASAQTLRFELDALWWAQVDSNHRPHDYQSCALAS